QRRSVAQCGAEISATEIELRLRRNGVECCEVYVVGSRFVSNHCKCCSDLRFSNGGCHLRNPDVRYITQVAYRRSTIPRQHIQCISQLATSIFVGFRGGGDIIAQAIDRERVRSCGNVEATLARASEEIRNIGVKPRIIAAHRPQSK